MVAEVGGGRREVRGPDWAGYEMILVFGWSLCFGRNAVVVDTT